MIHLKLDATDSTNSFLRELARAGNADNWTVVSTDRQIKGRGQQGANWFSDKFKNLTFSILIKSLKLRAKDQFLLSCAVSVGLFRTLERYDVPRLKVKWPNDILSGSLKLAGILIENSVMHEQISQSIVGVGINVNQDRFPDELPGAVSIMQLTGRTLDLEELLRDLVAGIREEFRGIEEGKYEKLRSDYDRTLFRKDVPGMFREPGGQPFVGQILGVSESGQLMIKKEDGSTTRYSHKEIEYL